MLVGIAMVEVACAMFRRPCSGGQIPSSTTVRRISKRSVKLGNGQMWVMRGLPSIAYITVVSG